MLRAFKMKMKISAPDDLDGRKMSAWSWQDRVADLLSPGDILIDNSS